MTTGASTGTAALPPLEKSGPHRRRLGLVSIVACFGGLLFGYDTGVVNGSEGPMAADLGLSLLQLGVFVGLLPFGAAAGALLCGRLSDAIGRRRAIILLAVLFFGGVLLVVFAPGGDGEFSLVGYAMALAGRLVLGLAVGGASTVVPVYLAELAPYEIRGSITGRNELAIVSGQLAAFVVNALIATVFGTEGHVWRFMFAMCAIPAIALFVGMLRMPESPRWLVEHGRREDALAVLRTIRTVPRAEAELEQIDVVAEEESRGRVGLGALLRNKWLVRIVAVGFGLSMIQSLTGISTVMFFGTRVLEESGMTPGQAVLANISFGVVAVIGGVVAVRNMDRVNRRTTFLLGLALTTSCHLLISLAAVVFPEGNPARPFVILVLVVAFVLAMQTFLNVAVWVWLAEIFPLHMRGLGMGIAAVGGWLVQGVLAILMPTLLASIGLVGAFLMFAVIGVASLLYVWRLVPETRGRTLEALEEDVTTGAIHAIGRVRRARARR
ncbi:sugar porter family MFS transporter [Rothia sp. AR01]|uniref:Sugar porter family MFS transporter n=1 Tax=Rothia santali TaxID=2949643 RepID=A0A9X2HB96_9MICC|nr:sugar porter family MFS transporter [Rothia santali]MCP3424527.1 sugar porter family MFS transporter [Rothia santali]